MHSAQIAPIQQCVNRPHTEAPPPPLGKAFEPLIGIRELAAWVGVSEHAVRKWCTKGPDAGLVPQMLRINGQIRFRPADVRTWLDTKEMR